MTETISDPEQEPKIFFGRRIPTPELAKVMSFGLVTLGVACLVASVRTPSALKGFATLLLGAYFILEAGSGKFVTDAIRRVSPEQRVQAEELVRKVAEKKGMPVPSVTVADVNYYRPHLRWTKRFGGWLPIEIRKHRLMNAGAIQLVSNTRHPERKWLHFERRDSWYLSGHVSRRFGIPLPVLAFLKQRRSDVQAAPPATALGPISRMLKMAASSFRSGIEMPSLPRLVRRSGQHAHHMLLTTAFLDQFTPEQREAVVDHELEHIAQNHSFRRLTRQPLQIALSKGRLFLVYAAVLHPAFFQSIPNRWALLAGASVATYGVRLVRMKEQCRWENQADDGPLRDGYATPLADFFEAAKPNSLQEPGVLGRFKETFVVPFNSHPPLRNRVRRARDYAALHGATSPVGAEPPAKLDGLG